ncbi:MAG: carbohydrate binding family 9 domain-containing protein [Candidatus Rariloculaceae bacterium]
MPFNRPKACFLTAVTAVFCVGGTQAMAQETVDEPKRSFATRTDTPPVIDGLIDDAVWQQAEVIDDFHQTRPGDGTPPTDRTEIYLLYDEDALYVAGRLHDSEPELINANVMRHNLQLGPDDRISVIIDPFNTGRNGYRFETNALGVRHDMLYQNVSQVNANWKVIWDVQSYIDEDGWTFEMEIPFKTLPFNADIDTWGFNFARAIRRRGEEAAWVSRNRTYNPSIVGSVSGFEGMDPGIGLDVVPSLAVTQQERFDPDTSESDSNPSLDVFYRVTPSLSASLTVNTDFSAVEVDNRQVNLTRFNLFFPERRDFFLRDADLFDFGRIGGTTFGGPIATSPATRENGRPFFSRRLGLSESGTPVDLEYGGKLSGRVGRFAIGTLAMRQAAFEDVEATDVFVSRVSANVLNESAIGFIATHGDPTSNLDNSVLGADFRYLNTHLPGGRVMEGDAWIQQSDTTGLESDDSAYGLKLDFPNREGLRGGLAVKDIERNFKPALGYINRANVRDLAADVSYTHFLASDRIQSVFSGLDGQRISSLDGGLQSQIFMMRLLKITTQIRDDFELRHTASKEVVAEPFNIYEDESRVITIPAGDYSFGENGVSIGTASFRPLSGRITYRDGEFYDGDKTTISGNFTWRQSANFLLGLRYDWNDIDLPQGRFISRLVAVNTEVNFSSRLSWISLIQYDNNSEVLGINTRLHWVPRAGQEGFIVLNHNVQDTDKDNSFQRTSSDLSIKFSYTFRF